MLSRLAVGVHGAVVRSRFGASVSDFWGSSEAIFHHRLAFLLVCGPIVLIGDSLELFGEFTAFALAGVALVPLAERLSFVTEQVAAHTNGTIGALLNATFGNAPELLISASALRQGFYRVVQLALLGSILCNLLFVFGVSCLIGGLRYHTQEVRMTSGNVSVGMLLIATSGLILPAALKISNEEMFTKPDNADAALLFSRFNSCVMFAMYVMYVFFQLVTHKDEFEDDDRDVDDDHHRLRHHHGVVGTLGNNNDEDDDDRHRTIEMAEYFSDVNGALSRENDRPLPIPMGNGATTNGTNDEEDDESTSSDDDDPKHSLLQSSVVEPANTIPQEILTKKQRQINHKRLKPQSQLQDIEYFHLPTMQPRSNEAFIIKEEAQISLQAGIVWLLAITIAISAMSDVLVDTIDGFALKSHISEVFTSVVVLPFFSNIAEQVSAVLFAYRNKMDLCVGITAGSAVQISLGVLPGTVLIGWAMDRSMSLFFNGFETCCLLMGVLSVSVILQGGTTNWLAGLFFIGVYLMIAAGFWFHLSEDLSTDEELLRYRNATTTTVVVGDGGG